MFTVNSNTMTVKVVVDQLLFSKDPHSSTIGRCLMPKLRRMVLTGQYIGSKRSQSRRMAPSKVRCGKALADISVTGVITARKVLASNFIPKVINMKVCGLWIKSTVKVLTGEMKEENYAENTQVTGLRTRSTVEAHSSSKIAIVMMDIG